MINWDHVLGKVEVNTTSGLQLLDATHLFLHVVDLFRSGLHFCQVASYDVISVSVVEVYNVDLRLVDALKLHLAVAVHVL